MDLAALQETLRVARAAAQTGQLRAGGWPGVAVALLLEGADDLEIAQLAGLNEHVSAWEVDPLTEALWDRYEIAPAPNADAAVELLAGLMAADLRVRPALVTGPMIRLLARLAGPEYDSTLANACFYAAEYLDCDCEVGSSLELELELDALPGPLIPDSLVRALASGLRSTLPLVQPPRSH